MGLFTRSKPLSAEAKIFQALKNAGKYGMYNYELNRISWKFATRISEMRRDGHNISRVYLGKGVHKYYLNEEN